MRKFIKALLSNNATMYDFAKRTEIRLNLLMRRVHDDDYLFFKNFSHINDGLFIDIGANCGQSAISFAIVNRNINIISFEPNRALEGDLRAVSRVLGNRHKFYMFGIGEKNARFPFFVPKVKKVFLTQEGTFVKDEIYRGKARLGPRFEIMEFEFETRNLDELNLAPTFVKIDVQGFEMGVIRGMRETLKKYHPILMIENNLKMVYIADMLNKLDYALYAYDRKNNLLRRHIDSRTCNIFAAPSQRGKNARVMETVNRRIEPYTPEEKKAL